MLFFKLMMKIQIIKFKTNYKLTRIQIKIEDIKLLDSNNMSSSQPSSQTS